MKFINKNNIIIATLAFVLGFSGHYLFDHGDSNKSATPIRESSVDYKYIDPLLVIDNASEKFKELDPLKKELEKYIAEQKNNQQINRASIYFRNLNNINWTGVNENDLYSPGSMLKVATLISYLKLANKDPAILEKKHYYNLKEEGDQYYKPAPLKPGYYNNLKLLQQMIVYSDNTAMMLLEENNIDEILKVYKELSMPNPVGSSKDFMSPLYYSRLFRLLYNSTYLPRTYSDQALELLTYTQFNEGITKYLPKNIEVAHKFGEQTFTEDGKVKSRELHDCGIVYYPGNTYLICIMTEGDDFAKLEKVIANISKIAFEYQSRQK
jgi:beta-lactamase class A